MLFRSDILGNSLTPSLKVKNLVVNFDSCLSFSQHVSLVCKSCYYHIRDFSRIRRIISRSVAITLANALVSSRLDYCNSLLYSLTKKEMGRLQRVQNTLCRITSRLPRIGLVQLVKGSHYTGYQLSFESDSRYCF